MKGVKMFKKFINAVQSTYSLVNGYNFDSVNPNLVRYFRTEYGNQWKEALTHHLYKKEAKNDKKAA